MNRARRLSSTLATLALCSLWLGVATPGLVAQEEAAQRRMIEAERLLSNGDADGARRALLQIADQFSGTSLAPAALLQAARVSYDLRDLDSAGTAAERLVQEHARTPQAASGEVLRVRITLDQATTSSVFAQAVSDLRTIVDLYPKATYPDLGARAEARTLIGDIQWRVGELDQASAAYLAVVEDEPLSDHTLEAYFGMARVMARLGSRTPALEYAQRAYDLARESETKAAQADDIERLLTLMHRHWVRPQAGLPRWQDAGAPRATGIELRRPRAVAMSRRGVMAITDQTGTYLVDADGAGQLVGDPRNPGRPFFDQQGNPYFPSADGILQPTGGASLMFATGGDKPKTLSRLTAGARGDLGEWVLVDRSNDEPDGFDGFRQWAGPLNTSGDAIDVATAPFGGSYVLTEGRPGRVLSFDRDHRIAGGFGGQWQKAVAVDTDDLGQVYILDEDSASILVLDANGELQTTLGPMLPNGIQLRGPEDLAVDGQGRILIADSKAGGLIIVQ